MPNSFGKLPRLKEDDIEKLKEYLKEKPFWKTKEVKHLIGEKFKVGLLRGSDKKNIEK